MGRPDKFLMRHKDKTLLQHVIRLAIPQVAELVVSANGDPQRLSAYQLPVVPDLWPDQSGPLAGIISVMSWAQKARPPFRFVATFAADTPYFPASCIAALREHILREDLDVCFARVGDQQHYAFALWSIDQFDSLRRDYQAGKRALSEVINARKNAAIHFSGDPRWFFNANSPADLLQLDAFS